MDAWGPSAFTPFFRRFSNERARENEDLKALYARVSEQHFSSFYAAEDAPLIISYNIASHYGDEFTEATWQQVGLCVERITKLETHIFRMPAGDLRHLSLTQTSDLRQFLRAKEHFFANEEVVLELLSKNLDDLVRALAFRLPKTFVPSPFTIPLIYAISDPRIFIENTIAEYWRDTYKDAGLFIELFRTLYLNLCAVSGINDPYKPNKPFKRPSEDTRPLDEIAHAYCKGTPLFDLFMAPVPLKFTFEERFSHMHVLGGSGAGKTTLLQNLILHDLEGEKPPSLIIVDSQGDLIQKLSHLELFNPNGPFADRFVLISPKDIDHPPALNIFDVNQDRLGAYDEAAKEQVVAGVIQTFDYLFAGLLGADLTAKQGVFFRFVARLMLALPQTMGRNATILDMIALMDDAGPYEAAIASLPPIQRNFFERDFKSKTFAQTKEQIRYRLNAILENPTLARLFTSPKTKIDLFKDLNRGSVIFVDTAKDFLKGSSAHFGRIFISLALQAILERAVIPEADRKPTFLIVDEAAAYFDSNIDDLLTEARKYKCGCVFAHQFLDQATSSLRASLAANTTIKMAGGVSTGDARALASDMRTTADFILDQPRLHFASHIRHVTPNAVSIPVPVGQLEAMPRLSDTQYRDLIVRNRERVSLLRSEIGSTAPLEEKIDRENAQSSEPALMPDRQKKPPNTDPSAASEDW